MGVEYPYHVYADYNSDGHAVEVDAWNFLDDAVTMADEISIRDRCLCFVTYEFHQFHEDGAYGPIYEKVYETKFIAKKDGLK